MTRFKSQERGGVWGSGVLGWGGRGVVFPDLYGGLVVGGCCFWVGGKGVVRVVEILNEGEAVMSWLRRRGCGGRGGGGVNGGGRGGRRVGNG